MVAVSYGDVVLETASDDVRRVVALASTEARALDHARVGTEHLLLGLLSDVDGRSAEVLRAAGASLAAARHKVSEVAPRGAAAPTGDVLPFTPRAQRALERAGRFSRQDRAAEVTSGHVLLGVLDVEGLACQVLRGLGVDVVRLRDAIVTSPDAIATADPDEVADRASIGSQPRCPGCGAVLAETLAEVPITTTSMTAVSVVYCAGCGATLGVLRPPTP